MFIFPGCVPADVTVVSGTVYAQRFGVENILSLQKQEKDSPVTNYWLVYPSEEIQAKFILNLGCTLQFTGIQLVNTHNAGYRDSATKQFRY